LPPLYQGLFYARRINMQNKNKNVTFFENFFSQNFHKFFNRENAAKMQQKSETEGLAAKLYCRITRYFLQILLPASSCPCPESIHLFSRRVPHPT